MELALAVLKGPTICVLTLVLLSRRLIRLFVVGNPYKLGDLILQASPVTTLIAMGILIKLSASPARATSALKHLTGVHRDGTHSARKLYLKIVATEPAL